MRGAGADNFGISAHYCIEKVCCVSPKRNVCVSLRQWMTLWPHFHFTFSILWLLLFCFICRNLLTNPCVFIVCILFCFVLLVCYFFPLDDEKGEKIRCMLLCCCFFFVVVFLNAFFFFVLFVHWKSTKQLQFLLTISLFLLNCVWLLLDPNLAS
jgi:hypothetical protein